MKPTEGFFHLAGAVLVRLLLLGVLVAAGGLYPPFGLLPLGGAVVGLAIAVGLCAAEMLLHGVEGRVLFGAALGLLLGLLLARLVVTILGQVTSLAGAAAHPPMTGALLAVALAGLGLLLGARRGARLSLAAIRAAWRADERGRAYKILDTSVIIDGRIADIVETGFLEGTLIVPQFVLSELQLVADSSDPLKRARGRKGLEVLQKVKKSQFVTVQVTDMDFPEAREVDQKLIELARSLQAKIVTNDFNLNRVAQVHGIQVLNANDLANAMKPVVLPGESLTVLLIKEGKEKEQAVAYLDDGTMVVVDNARKLIGQKIEVIVTSVLQTAAGKMIFGVPESDEKAREKIARRRTE